MLFDVSQDSYTLLQDASGHESILGFSVVRAGHGPASESTQPHISATVTPEVTPVPTAVRRRGRLTPRIAQSLVSTALRILDPSPTSNSHPVSTTISPAGEVSPAGAAGTPSVVDLETANHTAAHLAATANAARMALHAIHQRGQLAAWNHVLELPEDFATARDELEHYADALADQLTGARDSLTPALAELNGDQAATGSWSLPVPTDARRGVWAGRQHWIATALGVCDTARTRPTRPLQCSHRTAEALLRARADFFTAHGRGCTASNDTIVSRAIERHGATITPATGARYLRAITRELVDADVLIIHATGRHLRSIERLAARTHHGHHQKTAGNVVDANIPDHFMPHPEHSTDAAAVCPAPAYAQGLSDRLAARDARYTATWAGQRSELDTIDTPTATSVDNPTNTTSEATGEDTSVSCENTKSSTYTCGYGYLLPLGSKWVAHPRALARANTETPSPTNNPNNTHTKQPARTTPISVRAWRIADDLTRSHTGNALDNGPYTHLIGTTTAQMPLTSLARLIDTHTPHWATTRDVLAGLVHQATSTSTGFIALGLSTRPDNATGWMTTVLRCIDWDAHDHFPAWSRVAEAYQLHWCGTRRNWSPVG